MKFRTLGLLFVFAVTAVAGGACWNPHFTHSNADAPLLFSNYLVGGQGVFNKISYPGNLNIGALNTVSDTYLEMYMNVGSTADLYVYEPDDDTYYSIDPADGDQNAAIQAFKKHLQFRPNINEMNLTVTIDYTDAQYPIFKAELAEFMDTQHGKGTVWEGTVNHMWGDTPTIRRGPSGPYMPDDRIGYVRQGDTATDDVDLMASTFTGASTDGTPDPEITFERSMGALYAVYIPVGNPEGLLAAMAGDRTHPAGGGLKYKFLNPVDLTAGEHYYFVLMQECGPSMTASSSCAANMALSQDTSGNPINDANLPSGWEQGDINEVVGGDATGVNVVYYEFQVRYY